MGAINPTYKDRVRYVLQHKDFGTLLIDEPVGWEDDEKEYSRNETYHGIVTKFSNSLKFVNSGSEFIQLIYDAYGINAELRLIKDEQHPHTDEWVRVYDGYLDMSTYVLQDEMISIKFNSGGLEQLLKARESEQVELDRLTTMDGDTIPALQTQKVELDGRKIFLDTRLESDPKDSSHNTRVFMESRDGNDRTQGAAIPMNIVARSHEEVQAVQNISRLGTGYEGKASVGDVFFYNSISDRTLVLNFNLKFTYRVNSNRSRGERLLIRLVRYGNGASLDFVRMETILLDRNNGEVYDFNKNIQINQPQIIINLKKGESLSYQFFGRARVGKSPRKRGYFEVNFSSIESLLIIQEDSYFEKSTANMVLAHDVADRLITIATNKKNAFYSEFLGRVDAGYPKDGPGGLTGLTHGFAVRNFLPGQGEKNLYKPMTTSFKDFTDSFMAVWNVGLGIEKIGYRERVRIEDLRYFYNRNVTIKLPNQVKNVKRSVATKYYSSSVEIGYEKGGDYEEAMGLDEPNGLSTYTTIINRIKEVYSKVSKYRADSYGMEFARRKPQKDYPTEDTQYDNDIWVLDLKRGPGIFQQLKGSDGLQKMPTGIYHPVSATNLRFSPFNMILRHGWVLASGLKKYLSDYIRYGSSKVNSSLKTQLFGKNEYAENGIIVNSELDKPYYLPEWIEFEHVCDFDIMRQVEGSAEILGKKIPNFYGLVEFKNEKNEIERGYLFELKPNKEGKWKVLKSNS